MNAAFPIVYQDEHIAIIDKPARCHVHPPTEYFGRVPYEENAMAQLRDHLGKKVYPVHRLDYATSGLLLFGLEPLLTRPLMESFAKREVEKEYWAFVRGWTADEGVVDKPLTHPETKIRSLEAITRYQTHSRYEVPEFVDKYPASRYAWVEVKPLTGKRNQIRRHFSGIAHPVIGDRLFGAREHNNFFERKLGLPGLWLRAVRLSLKHPVSGAMIDVRAPESDRWEKLRKVVAKFAVRS